MRARELWREAARNFGSGASRGVASLVVFLALALLAGLVASRGVVAVVQEAAAFRDAGASAYHLSAPGRIDGLACDRLASIDGIEASGATRSLDALRLALLPDLPVPSFAASPGMMRFVGAEPQAPDGGLVVDTRLATSLGFDSLPHPTTLSSDAPVVIAATYPHPDDGRDSSLSGAALGIAVGEAPFDTCWARFWPPTGNPLDLIGVVVTGGEGRPGELVQWNPTLGRVLDPHAEFERIPFVWLGGAGSAVAAVLAYVTVRVRRLELASALHAGVSRSSLVGIALAETALWLVPACALALAMLAFAAAWENPDPPLAAWAAGARAVSAAAAAWTLAVALTTMSVREKHLVRFFQQR